MTEGLVWRPGPPGGGAAPTATGAGGSPGAPTAARGGGNPGAPTVAATAPAGAVPGGPAWPPVLVAEDLLASGILAAFSSRAGGRSGGPYESLNLGLRVGDDLRTALGNRRRLATVLSVAGLPWAVVRQVHSPKVVQARGDLLGQGPPEARPPLAEADGMITAEPGLLLAVFTADCVPVLLADPQARVVGALHAGWRGLAAGVLERGVEALVRAGASLDRSVAMVGPAIGPCCYQVGPEVADAVGGRYDRAPATTRDGALAIDTAAAAVQALEAAGVGSVRAAGECTAHQPERFFSYRRDGLTGRQAGVIAMLPGARPGARPRGRP